MRTGAKLQILVALLKRRDEQTARWSPMTPVWFKPLFKPSPSVHCPGHLLVTNSAQ